MGRGYGQFCPIAKAAEILCDRWTPLLLRELMCGSRHFNELSAGLPLMSRALLAQRLRELEDAGLLERRPKPGGRGHEHVLTPAGEAVRPIIEALGMWSQRWGGGRLDPEDIDEKFLFWTLRRVLLRTTQGVTRLVLRFDFRGLKKSRLLQRTWWLVVSPDDVDVCLKDPGYEPDATVVADLATFVRALLGHVPLDAALKARTIVFHGARDTVRRLPEWLFMNGAYARTMGIHPPPDDASHHAPAAPPS